MDISFLADMAEEAEAFQELANRSPQELAIEIIENRKIIANLNHRIDRLKADADALHVEILTDLVEAAQGIHPEYLLEMLEKRLAEASKDLTTPFLLWKMNF